MSEGLKVIVAGSRSIIEMAHVEKAISLAGFVISEVVCGEANGVDTLGKVWARLNNVAVKSMRPNWYPLGVYNKLAGFERNEEMGDYADALIAVYDGKSGGTKHMINYMKKLNKPYFVHDLSKYVEPVNLFGFS
jgi:hypothetical protein